MKFLDAKITPPLIPDEVIDKYHEVYSLGEIVHNEDVVLTLVKKGMKALIVDIRNNGGGLVDQSVQMADYFLDTGTNILIERDNKQRETITKAETKKKITMPTVVLVNEYSASASEIFSAAVKEKADNVTIVGTKTFGKWTIQTLHQFPDWASLKYTIGKRFPPSGLSIDHTWITPDVIVEFDASGYVNNDIDNQLEEAKSLFK